MKQAIRREIELSCERLSIAYSRALDFRDYDAFFDLFTEDAELDAGQPLAGLSEIREAIRRRPDELKSRHVITNVFIDVLSPTQARGISYLTLYRHIGPESLSGTPIDLQGVAAVGHYEDRFTLTDSGWRISRRKLHLAFRRPSD